jgi:hypothetical protein
MVKIGEFQINILKDRFRDSVGSWLKRTEKQYCHCSEHGTDFADPGPLTDPIENKNSTKKLPTGVIFNNSELFAYVKDEPHPD